MKKGVSRLVSTVLATTVLASSLVFTPVSALAAPSFASVGGWNETIYAQISGVSDSNVTGVSYSGPTTGSLTGDDLTYLVRDNKGGVRIDIPGLKAGTYTLTVTTSSGTVTQSNINVPAQDRSGYAHYNYSEGVGAYNNDGTLKANAKVLYVTDANKNTVSVTSSDGTTVTGIGHILNSTGQQGATAATGYNSKGGLANNNAGIIKKLADDGTPLVVRIIGSVSLPDGLTAYDSIDYGGTEGDNGAMARMQSGKDVTIEGIGYDAQINGWGIHFIKSTVDAGTERGTSFEVRNIEFWGSPEDSIGMEGQQEGSTITASVERIWIHNCSFLPQSLSQYAESDKSEGDGCCDFKRGQYMTMSYCYFYKAHKTNLIGSSDSSLQYHVTWHHNMWELCEARGPLVRNTNIHIYNNYYLKQTSYAMNPRANAYIFSEYNTMEYCKNPMDVRSGGIKSYNDTLLSCGGAMSGTVVTDKSTKVSTSNKYANFDTDSSVSYIPSGNYNLQESASDAKATCLAYSGTMKENVITEAEVDASVISTANRPTAPVSLPFSASYGKNGSNQPTATGNSVVSNVVYNPTKIGSTDMTIKGEGVVFNLAQAAKVTMTGTSGSYDPVLSSDTGKVYITTSGTAILPAGTYVIQSSGFDAGSQAFKECKINSLEMEAADPNETVETTTYVAPSTEATTQATTQATTSSQGGGSEEPDTEATTSAPYTGAGLVWDYTNGTNTLNVNADANDWNNATAVTYNGSTFTEAVKMESSSNISFTAPGNGNLTIVTYSSNANPTVKINGESVSVSKSGAVTVPVSAGNVTITKGTASTYLYVLEFNGSSDVTTESTTEATTKATTQATTEATTESTTKAPAQGYSVNVGSASAKVGENVTIPVNVTGGVIDCYTAVVTYDPSKLTFVSVTSGVTDSGIDLVSNDVNGTITIAATNANGVSASTLFNVNFTAKAEGSCNIGLSFTELVDVNDNDITPTISTGSVTVTPASATATKLGDVDKDGDVDDVDASLLLKHLLETRTITDSVALANADCDGVAGVDMRDVIWILNNKTVVETTTEATTQATTQATTETTTQATTEATTQAPVSGLNPLSAGEYSASTILSDSSSFNVSGSTTTSGIKIDENGYVEFKVNNNATVVINFKCGSTNTSKTAAVSLNGQTSAYLAGKAQATDFTVSGLSAGTYRITGLQTGGTTAQILSVTVSYGSAVTTEKTTETTTKVTTTKATTTTTTTTTTTEATTEATTTAPVQGYSHNFNNGTSSSFYTITGSLSTSKGEVTYGGTTITQCLKMESKTSITFNATSGGTLTLVFGGSTVAANKTVKIDGESYTADSNGVVTAVLGAGTHTITKGEAINLFYMNFGGSGSTAVETTTEATTKKNETTTKKTETTTKKTENTSETTTINISGAINVSSASELKTAVSNAAAGDVINIAPGTYKISQMKCSKSGSSSKPITITCASGRAVLDCSNVSGQGIVVSGKYYNFSNLTVKNAGDNGMYVTGSNINVENCIFQGNYDTGLQISAGGNNVLIKNCTSFDNSWAENADGFAAKLGVGQNVVFDGCISYNNADDGWDLYSKSGSQQNKYPITLKNCIAFNNGTLTDGTEFADGDRNGFKLGGMGYSTANVVENCIAFNNGTCGFTDNNNPGLAVLKNCTGYKNAQIDVKKHNFSVYRATEGLAMTNCLSYVLNADTNGGMDRFAGTSSGTSYNANATVVNSILGCNSKYYKVDNAKITDNTAVSTSGTEVSVTDSMFESLTLPYKSLQTVHTDMRNADGSIKLNGFLQPKSGTVIAGMGAKFDN